MRVSVILAAGEGTRMKSKLPKVLHKVAGKPMIELVIEAARKSEVEKISVVLGHGKEKIEEYLKKEDVIFRYQPIGESNPYGTGFAVMQSLEDFADEDTVIILNGDTPLINHETLNGLLKFHEEGNYSATILTAMMDNPFGYGRIIRDDDANISKIVEQKDATEKEKLIREINSGIFVFNGSDLKYGLNLIDTNNSQGELYLTDVISILVNDNKKIGGYKLRNNEEIIGVNSRDSLCECSKILQERINREYMIRGVTLIDDRQIYIEKSVTIGRDTVIYPGAILMGNTTIGEDCIIYGNTRIIDSTIGNGVEIDNCLIENSSVGDNSKLGPYSHLRPNSNIGKNTKIGNFVEVKNSNFGDGSKAGHLAYIGDGDVGENVNIGCGVIFANYDGKNKHRSIVGDNSFIGSNSNLVAPVEIEKNAYVAAGSTITKTVLEGELSVERAKQVNIKGWLEKKGLIKEN